MTTPDGLDTGIHEALSNDAKRHILETCWSVRLEAQEYENQAELYRPYFEQYARLCINQPRDGRDRIYGLGRLTHNQVLEAARLAVKEDRDRCIQQLLHSFDSTHNVPGLVLEQWLLDNIKDRQDFVRCWLSFGTRALLLINAQNWVDNTAFNVYLSVVEFPPSKEDDTFNIRRSLNLRNLSKIGGLKIRWTDLLSEHLVLERSDTQLAVFHQLSFLEMSRRRNLYPDEFIEEVRWTLSVLLPKFDKKCKKWLERETAGSREGTDSSCPKLDTAILELRNITALQRNIQKANFFRDRLIAIRDVYDTHRPQTLMQYLHDDRDPVRQWGFLIAALVFIFGMAQAVEGAIQCYKAYYPTAE